MSYRALTDASLERLVEKVKERVEAAASSVSEHTHPLASAERDGFMSKEQFSIFEEVLAGVETGSSGGSSTLNISFSIPITAWEASDIYDNYAYQAEIAISGLEDSDTAQIIFNPASVIEANKAFILSSGDTLEEAVRIYAVKTPDVELTGVCLVNKGA